MNVIDNTRKPHLHSTEGQQIMKSLTPPNPRRDIEKIDQEIADIVSSIRLEQAKIEQIDLEMATLRDRLVKLLRERGGNWSDANGYARLLSEGIRTYYDTQNLDELILTDPLHYGWLKDYRRQTLIPQRVQVR